MIIGVNKYQIDEQDAVDILEIDNEQVRDSQLARLASIREARDDAEVESALNALTKLQSRVRVTFWGWQLRRPAVGQRSVKFPMPLRRFMGASWPMHNCIGGVWCGVCRRCQLGGHLHGY